MFDNRGAHCACAALRARPSPAPPERARRPGSRRTRAHAAAEGRSDTRLGKWAAGRGLATRHHRGWALRGPAAASTSPPPSLFFIFLEQGSFLPPSPFCRWGKAHGGARGHLESLFFAAACCHRQYGGDSPALGWKLGICTAKAFCCTFPVYVVQMGILETCH